MKPYRLEIPEELGGGWVEIADRLGWAQHAYIESQGVKATQITDERGQASSTIEADYVALGLAKLRTYVVAWSLEDEDGKPIPVSEQGFLSPDFDAEIGGWIIRTAEEHYASRRRTKSGGARPEPDAGRVAHERPDPERAGVPGDRA